MGLSLQWGFRPPHCADLSVSTPPPLAGIQLWPFRLCVHRNRSIIRWFYPFVSHFLSKTRVDLRFLRSGGLLSSERAVLKLFTHRFRREENPPNTMKCFWATVAHVSGTGPPCGFWERGLCYWRFEQLGQSSAWWAPRSSLARSKGTRR